MKTKRLFILIISIVLVMFIWTDSEKEKKDKESTYPLKNIDYSDGNYALVVKNYGKPIIIDSNNILAKYGDKIQVESSWTRFIPGEGGFKRSMYIFKNRKLEKSILYKAVSTFETANIEQYGKTVEFVYESFPKEEFLKQKSALNRNPNVFIYDMQTLNDSRYEFHFSVKLPSFFTKIDDYFDSDKYRLELKNKIKKDLKTKNFANFTLRVHKEDTLTNKLGEPVLSSEYHGFLTDEHNKSKKIDLKGFEIHRYNLSFTVDSEKFYHALQKYDFDKHIKKDTNLDKVIERINGLLLTYNKSLIGKVIIVEGYKKEISFVPIEEFRYMISYFKVETL